MAFRIRYQVNVEYVPPGIGAMTGNGVGVGQPGIAPTGVGPTLALFDNNQLSGLVSPTFTGTDVTNLTNAMAADMVTQMTANLARIAAFATGGS